MDLGQFPGVQEGVEERKDEDSSTCTSLTNKEGKRHIKKTVTENTNQEPDPENGSERPGNKKEDQTKLKELESDVVEEENEEAPYGFENLAIETPEEGSTFENPPDGGCRAWLIVLACSAISVCNLLFLPFWQMSVAGLKQDLQTKKDQEIAESLESITAALTAMQQLCAPIAAITMVLFGYRVTATVGSFMAGGGFLMASFLSKNMISLIGVLVAGLSGMGMSFLRLVALVPILEYFVKKRMRAIFISSVTTLIFLLITIVVIALLGPQLKWGVALKIQAVFALIAFLVGLTLTDLRLTLSDESRQTFVSRTVGFRDWSFVRNPVFYLLIGLNFCYLYGIGMPKAGVTQQIYATAKSVVDFIVCMVITPVGSLVGLFAAWITKKCTSKSFAADRLFFTILGTTTIVVGVAAMITPAIKAFAWYATFLGIFGFVSAYNESLLNVFVPDLFGRYNIRIVEGFVGLAVGLAGLLKDPTVAALSKMDAGFWTVLYISGALLILAGTLSLISVLFLRLRS